MKLTNLAQIKKIVGDKIFKVTFKKKDGSMRTMKCTLNVKKYLPDWKPKTKPAGEAVKDEDVTMVTCLCLDKETPQWRTFKIESLTDLEVL